MLKPVTEKQFLVRMTGVTGAASSLFQSATEPKEVSETADWTDPTSGTVYKHIGFTSRENVTLSKYYDPTTDHDLVSWYKALKSATGADTKFTVSYQPVLPDRAGTLYPGSKATELKGCQVVSFALPKVERVGGSSLAMLTIEIAYDDWSVA